MPDDHSDAIVHATAVAVGETGALIIGRSGQGKSTLALRLIGLGARLVADDRTALKCKNGSLIAAPVAPLAGLIEARGVGILEIPFQPHVQIGVVIDLDQEEDMRLPPIRTCEVLDVTLPCLHESHSPAWPEAVFLYLKGKRRDPDAPHAQ